MKFKRLHSWNLSPLEAIEVQKKLKQRIKLSYLKAQPRLVAGCDVAFKGDKAIGIVVILNLPKLSLREYVRRIARVKFPYIPGLLTFREGPVLEQCFKATKFEPDLIIFDGQGISHPRNMGLATHLGILLDRPTIGCAKTHLFGEYTEPEESRGSFSYLLDKKGKRLGAVLRTKDNIRPLFVSPGYKIDLDSCLKLILMCTKKFRLPEPLRLAHHLSRQR